MKFVATFVSESGDTYIIKFSARRAPLKDEQWLKILKKNKNIPKIEIDTESGPGIAGTFLHLEQCIEVD